MLNERPAAAYDHAPSLHLLNLQKSLLKQPPKLHSVRAKKHEQLIASEGGYESTLRHDPSCVRLRLVASQRVSHSAAACEGEQVASECGAGGHVQHRLVSHRS